MDRSERNNDFCHDNAASSSKIVEKLIDESQLTGELYLSGKNLTDLPGSIIHYDLSDLHHLDLSKNCLNELPCFLFNFLSLEHLNCYHNFIKAIPISITQLKHLVVLNLSHNLLSTFPPFACQLQCLQILNISNNKLSSLPEDVSRLKELMELDVSRNMLTGLPDSLGSLHSLKSLNVHRNQLLSFNPALVNLKLTKLDLSVNKITVVPLELHAMTSLDDFNLNNNPILIPPPHVVMKGRQHIMAYLSLQQFKLERSKLGNSDEFPRKTLQKRLSSSIAGLRSISLEAEGQLDRRMMFDSGYDTGDTQKVTSRAVDDRKKAASFARKGFRNNPCERQKILLSSSLDTLHGHKPALVKTNSTSSDVESLEKNPVALINNNDDDDDDDDDDGGGGDNDSDDSSVGSLHSQASTETLNKENEVTVSDISLYNKSEKIFSRSKINGDQPNLIDIGFIVSENNSLPEGHSDSIDEEPEFYKRFSDLSKQRMYKAEKIKKCLSGKMEEFNDLSMDESEKISILSPKCKKMLESMSKDLSDHNPVLTIRRNIQQVSHEKNQAARLKRVIETLLKTKIDEDVATSLKDGVLLCQLANLVLPNSIPNIYKSQIDTKLSEAKCRVNVESFLSVCDRIGIKEDSMCCEQDILECRNLVAVCDTVLTLIKMAMHPRQSAV